MGWPDCVVILIDIPGIKKLAREGNSEASLLMMKFHKLVQNELRQSKDLRNIKHAYVWNDSVALLSRDGAQVPFRAFLRDADGLKRKIDSFLAERGYCPAYGIAVKGQAFPSQGQSNVNMKRVTVLRTSSYAMANCFEIENVVRQKIKKKVIEKKPWYIDERLAEYIPLQSSGELPVNLLPSNQKRKIHLIDGYLFDEAQG